MWLQYFTTPNKLDIFIEDTNNKMFISKYYMSF